jgi:hypothetical protein
MEVLLLAFDCLALFILVFFSVKDDRRPPGTPSTGPFRYIENLAEGDILKRARDAKKAKQGRFNA